jgi:hypothetical protein
MRLQRFRPHVSWRLWQSDQSSQYLEYIHNPLVFLAHFFVVLQLTRCRRFGGNLLHKVLHMTIRSKVLLCLRCGDVEGPREAKVGS